MNMPSHSFGAQTTGVIESVKRGVIKALKRAFDTNYPDAYLAGVHVDMEYPVTQEEYPGIWVQFSLSTIQRGGIGMEVTDENGQTFYHWRFTGTIQVTVIALTSLERDRMADGVINLFAFGRYVENMKSFSDALKSYEFVAIALDQDGLTPGGQSVNVGVPWDQDQIAYEDSYGINCFGEFYMSTDPRDPVMLSQIQTLGHLVIADKNPDGLGEWV